jgi:hypothetical protein
MSAVCTQLDEIEQRHSLQEKASVILPKLVKRFFNEKEVTSSLVMDALFAGCRLLEAATAAKKPMSAQQVVFIDSKRGLFFLQGDALQLWSCASFDSAPASKLKVCVWRVRVATGFRNRLVAMPPG